MVLTTFTKGWVASFKNKIQQATNSECLYTYSLLTVSTQFSTLKHKLEDFINYGVPPTVVSTADMFLVHTILYPKFTPGTYVWSPPPPATDARLVELRKARMETKLPLHIVLIQRLMTPGWLKQLNKAADCTFTIDASRPFWPSHQFEPLVVSLFFAMTVSTSSLLLAYHCSLISSFISCMCLSMIFSWLWWSCGTP